MASDPKPFTYDYEKIVNKNLSLEQVDGIGNIVIKAGTGTWATILAFFKMIFIAAWFFVRRSIIEIEKERAVQEYNLKLWQKSMDGVNNDNMD